MSKLYLGAALPNAPYAPPSYDEDFRDDYETDGNANGRTGWTVQTRSTFGSQINAISASGGTFGGTTGSAAFAWHQVADPSTARVTRILGTDLPKDTGTLGAITSHLSLDTGTITAFWFNLSRIVSGGVSSGAVAFQHLKNVNSGTNIVNLTTLRYENGDAFTEVWSGASVTVYMNGRQAWPTVDASAHVGTIGTGVVLSGRFGLRGDHGASTYADFWASSADEAWIMGKLSGRIVAINADSGGDWLIPIDYNGIIGRVDYAIYDASDDSVEIDWTRATITNDVIEINTTAAQTPTAGTHYVMLRRWIGSGNYVYFRGPTQTIGLVGLQTGQSLGVHGTNQTTTSTLAISTPAWRIDGSDTVTDVSQRRQLPQGADKVISWLSQTLSDLASLPVQIIAAGRSSTSISERLPGGTIYEAESDGIEHAGGRINFAIETGGQNETANLANFKAQVLSKWQARRTANGGTLMVVIDTMNKSWTNSDDSWQTINRGLWELTQEHPDLFVWGAHCLDLRSTDSLHLGTSTADAYASQAVWNARRGRNLAFHLGETALDYRGPRMVSVQRLSATSVKVVFDLDDFDSLELINSASEFHGGLRFSASTNPASPIWPTAATVDASPSGGTQGVTFTFASNSFPTSVSVWCGYGANPHNPLQNSTINSTTWDTAASTIRGVKSGLPSVGVQPYHGSTVDYITAT